MIQIGEKLECWAEVEQERRRVEAWARWSASSKPIGRGAHPTVGPPSPSEALGKPHQAHPRRGKSRPYEPRPALRQSAAT